MLLLEFSLAFVLLASVVFVLVSAGFYLSPSWFYILMIASALVDIVSLRRLKPEQGMILRYDQVSDVSS